MSETDSPPPSRSQQPLRGYRRYAFSCGMLTNLHRARAFWISALAICCTAGAPALLTRSQQPWASSDGRIHLLRPAAALPTTSDAAFNTLEAPGWRLDWSAQGATPGRLIIRLALKVRPAPPERTATEVFQVGVSRDPATVRSCLTYGLDSGSGRRQPDRLINGIRYAVWSNGDAGMSQQINAIDLRTVVSGACYAVERFSTSETASAGDQSMTLSESRGALQLDATLASLRIGAGCIGRYISQASTQRPFPDARVSARSCIVGCRSCPKVG